MVGLIQQHVKPQLSELTKEKKKAVSLSARLENMWEKKPEGTSG